MFFVVIIIVQNNQIDNWQIDRENNFHFWRESDWTDRRFQKADQLIAFSTTPFKTLFNDLKIH